ncbi:methylosome protein 50-like isoform X2 [Monomorium pharaonis]|uniref:methylosome protein 50-like isoform X2 n=1 Tax=Monomorium pharaonis TaxID=307658 RepID=UPI001745FB99|nr:methylosome protein 50-like isoform X2 [Monomorium pharaonis]
MEEWTMTPNSNGDVFRNLLFSTDRTLVETKQLQFLSIYDENNALLGGTNMVDLSWNGILWHYKDLSDFSREKASLVQQLDSGVCDAVYLTKNKFVCVGDSGAVQIYEIIQTNKHDQFQQLAYTCQHDDTVLTISMFANQRNIVTGGMDCCLKIWDVEDLIATYSYSFAHTDIITSIDVKPMCNSIFVSVSLDSESLLWDYRLHQPANCIFRKNNCPLSAVSWNTNLDHLIAIGTIDGSIVLIDTRKTETPLFESTECDRSIHKLLFNPNSERKDQLACCCDNETVKIFDSYREMLQVYEDSSHNDFVRGLACTRRFSLQNNCLRR